MEGKSVTKKWDHNALQRDLADHFRQKCDLMVWEDMPLAAVPAPRPDVFTIKKSFSHFLPLVYEVKVSRSDFLSDVTSGKWQKYLPFAGAVVFAVPKGLISKAELPAGTGLIVRSESGWRMQKRPTLNPIDSLPKNTWMKLLIDGIDRQLDDYRREVITPTKMPSVWEVSNALRKKMGDRVADFVREALLGEENMRAVLAEHRKQLKSIKDKSHHRINFHISELKMAESRLDSEQKQLARSLGLKEDATLSDLSFAIREERLRLDKDAQIKQMKRALESAQKSLAMAIESVNYKEDI